jgi:hypothetical protein
MRSDAGGVRGVSPRQPEILPASTAEEGSARFCRRRTTSTPSATLTQSPQGCGTPLTSHPDGTFSPAANSRLFWEDIPFGLCILKHLAELLGDLPVPTVEQQIRWHQNLMGKEFLLPSGRLNPLLMMETGAAGKYGLHRIEDVVAGSIPTPMLGYKMSKL